MYSQIECMLLPEITLKSYIFTNINIWIFSYEGILVIPHGMKNLFFKKNYIYYNYDKSPNVNKKWTNVFFKKIKNNLFHGYTHYNWKGGTLQ